ncbi:MAG: hypothetical protein A3I39_01145 [Candidatus Yanofskybacteria bacterium RIFCSPLOWO2_02_FULL_47_9b]|uniref:DUF4352 domain-containing protein n=1 Tax=Candidatus Yanofskybacteria bacterium RIFCSPLOWO2_02_FULL_47_9b TaxID=1802708 RepID=A0A1F8H8G1_9BACT|nr:MAG: hypothetical protein A3I39_01145 [Candidatus Yanofskybacteria bacterium RIFCSPLOWO2_02_FULL_47_9b]
MNTKIFVGIGAVIIAIVVAIWFLPSAEVPGPSVSPQALAEQTKQAGEIAIKVVPIDISQDALVWQFKVVLDTHSGELNQDMVAIAVLVGDNQQKPALVWQEESLPAGRQAPSGHHREGVLEFTPITPRPRTVELRMSGLGSVTQVFTWDL